MESDESRDRQRWSGLSGVPHGKLATLLFLLDNGDITFGGTERYQDIAGVKAARDAMEAVLCDPHHNFCPIKKELQKRHSTLLNYEFIDIGEKKEDEELLTMMQAYRILEVDCHDLKQKATKVQSKLGLTAQEVDSSFFIYAENLRLSRLCNDLTPLQVLQMMGETDKVAHTASSIDLDELIATEGLKEALFFYLIRKLELENKLNRIYTDRLEVILQNIGLKDWAISLSQYPAECRPAGHCVVFCVTKDREGSDGEIKKVRGVFEDCLGYTLTLEENPTEDTLNNALQELQRPKYRFYDCLVLWFMAHGDPETLKLADDTQLKRQDIIEKFSRIDNFKKKPKIFFMASCQGTKQIPINDIQGVLVATDALKMNKGLTFSEFSEDCRNITAVSYQMDRLVASATLPDHYAFRLEDGGSGSVYVDIVCRLIKKYPGHNLTQVLEKVSNEIHQIKFFRKELKGLAKQACYYESTLQKTFIIPSHVNNKSENCLLEN